MYCVHGIPTVILRHAPPKRVSLTSVLHKTSTDESLSGTYFHYEQCWSPPFLTPPLNPLSHLLKSRSAHGLTTRAPRGVRALGAHCAGYWNNFSRNWSTLEDPNSLLRMGIWETICLDAVVCACARCSGQVCMGQPGQAVKSLRRCKSGLLWMAGGPVRVNQDPSRPPAPMPRGRVMAGVRAPMGELTCTQCNGRLKEDKLHACQQGNITQDMGYAKTRRTCI